MGVISLCIFSHYSIVCKHTKYYDFKIVYKINLFNIPPFVPLSLYKIGNNQNFLLF